MFSGLKSLFSRSNTDDKNNGEHNGQEQQQIQEVHQVHRTPPNPMDFYKKTFYKITNYTENHNGFQYRDGLNIDTQPFGQDDFCKNGLYFYDLQHLWRYRNMGVNVRKVTMPEDAVYLEEEFYDMKKYKANKLVLGEKIEIGSDKFIQLIKDTNEENNKWVSNYMSKFNDDNSLNFCLKYNFLDALDDFENYEEDEENDIPIEFYKPAFKMAFIKKFFLNKNNLEGLFVILSKKEPVNIKNLIQTTNLNLQIDDIHNYCYISIDELIQISFRTRDVTFIKYLKEYYIPRILDITKTNRNMEFLTSNPNKLNEIRTNILNKIPIANIADFDNLLMHYNACISGSFILNCLTPQKFKPNDIDIFVNDNNTNDFYNYLKHLFTTNNLHVISAYETQNKYSHFITKSYKINLSNKTEINLIGTPDVVKFIENYVDFNFNQCVYNGKDILISFNPDNIMNSGKITNEYINYIFSTELNDDTVYPIINTLNRMIKYTERGFMITNYKDFIEKIELFLI